MNKHPISNTGKVKGGIVEGFTSPWKGRGKAFRSEHRGQILTNILKTRKKKKKKKRKHFKMEQGTKMK